jgi:hypothetical protein
MKTAMLEAVANSKAVQHAGVHPRPTLVRSSNVMAVISSVVELVAFAVALSAGLVFALVG